MGTAFGWPAPVSPFTWVTRDSQDRALTVTINFNDATRALTSVVISADAGCSYTRICVGVGANGRPDSSAKTFSFSGSRTINAAQLAAAGLSTVDDVIAQFTATP